jgi:glucose/arabinose dehydrogenase
MLELIGNFSSPVYVTSDPANPDREFVVEKDGRIMAWQNGAQSVFLDLNNQANPALDFVDACGERGLLSMAFPPDYGNTHLFYVLYNRSEHPDPALLGDVQIDEFRTQDGAVVAGSRRPVLTIGHPTLPLPMGCQHNGGQMQFGPDGSLYISSGDGYDYDASQDLDDLLGKVLRIQPAASGGAPYTIPQSNPFVGVPGADEIWSYGVRNPWRFSFDRLTGAFILGDVGDNNWEEINYDPVANAGRGDNFGWSECEGLEIYNPADPTHPTGSPCALTGATMPAYTFPHTVDQTIEPPPTQRRCAAIGGYVARDQSLGALYGRYLFADLCSGRVYSAAPAASMTDVCPAPITIESPSTFGEDASGRLYIAGIGGAVYRIVGSAATACGAPPPATDPPGGGDPGGGDPGGGDPGGGDPGAGGGEPGGGGDGADPGAGEPPGDTCGGKLVTQAVPQTSGRVDGTTGADVILGSDGADRIAGHGGGDLICAGDGDDTVKGGGGADKLLGGPGGDGLNGGGGSDKCKGGPGKDVVKSC